MEKQKQQDILDVSCDKEGITVVSFRISSICNSCDIEQISQSLQDVVSEAVPMVVIVDLDGVTFFSSQMLGILVDIWRRLSEYQGKLFICGVSRQLNSIFRITNLDRLFEFCSDRTHAMARAAEEMAEDNS